MENYLSDYIRGEQFITVTDFQFNPENYDDFNQYPNTFTIDNLDKFNYSVLSVYCHTHWVKELFRFINKNNISKSIILVSHNSDDEVNEELFKRKPDNIIKWFGQNINYKHQDLISLPIGLENMCWYPWKIDVMKNKLSESKTIRNLLYVNHSIRTYPRERSKPYELFRNKIWVTLVEGRNGEGFDNYIDNVFKHKFVCSPRGNGIDTHRFWEALHMFTIPIVIRNINNSFYNDLPIVYVDSWEEVTEYFLLKKYEEIEENKRNGVYNMNKLTFTYWKNLIQNSINI